MTHTIHTASGSQARANPEVASDMYAATQLQSPTTGLWLHVREWPAKRSGGGAEELGVCFLVHGYGEHLGRYDHVGMAISAAGFRVIGLDHQGHGQSEGDRGFVRHFDDYVGDLLALMARVSSGYTEPRREKMPFFVVGHSMGGLISSLAVQRAIREPRLAGGVRFAGVVLSAPFFALDADKATPLKKWMARTLGAICPKAMLPDRVPPEDLSRNPALVERVLNDPLGFHVLGVRVRLGWAAAALTALDDVHAGAGGFSVPLLAMHGTDDRVVNTDGIRDFYEAASSADKRLVPYEGLYHELFNEPERAQILGDVVAWMHERCDK